MEIPTLLGIIFGTFTGIIPGIHPNLVATLLSKTNFLNPTIIIFSTAITHTFLNTIPAIHLSSPDPESALALHPSQEYSQQGKAHEAVLLTLIGSTISLILFMAFIPLLYNIIKPTYTAINKAVPFLLLATAIFLILHQKNKKIALVIFLISGVLGYFSLNSEMNNPLLPLFTGLFGIPSLLINSDKNIVKQKITEPKITKKSLKTIFSSLFFGSFFSFLPAVGAAQAAAVQSTVIKNKSKADFLILTGCLNTVNILFSVIMLSELNKARNGAVAVIKEMGSVNLAELKSLFYIALLITLPGVVLCILISRAFIKLRNKISTKTLSRATIAFLLLVTLIMTKLPGMLILIIATIIGYLPYKLNTTKTTLMGCLMIPTLMFYFSLMF